MRLDIDLNLFLTEHNDKAIMLISACYVNCSKFNSKFDKMKKFLIILFCILASCQNPLEIKTNNSDNLKNMNITTDGKIKSK